MAAKKIVKDVSKTDNNWYIQNSIWVAKRDAYTIKDNARKKAIAEGRAEKTIEDAKNFYANGVSIDIIAKSLKITPEEVEKIVK